MSDRTEALLRDTPACELCGSVDGLAPVPVSGAPADHDGDVLACQTCRAQHDETAELDATHWYCLREAIWSEVPAVQVVAWRMLQRMREQDWAASLLEQAYLAEDVLAWANAASSAASGDTVTKDSHGTPLADGDSVTLIKALPVKGANFTAKRGTVVKNIRLSDDPGLVEGKVNNVAIFLKTEFVRKA
jgi:protein PhnA